MAKVSTSITIDAEVKAKAQELFADLGLDFSTAINMFLRQSIRENGIPFAVRRGPVQEGRPGRESAGPEPDEGTAPEAAAGVPPEPEKPPSGRSAPGNPPEGTPASRDGSAPQSAPERLREYKSYTDMDEMIRDLMT